MLRGYRGKIAKIGLTIAGIVVALAIAWGFIQVGLSRDANYQRQADYHGREYATYTQEQIRQDCFPLADKDKGNCVSEKRHEYREDRRNERELVAQMKSANWAFIMGAAAVAGMMLSIVGVALVWTTFREARRSADAAHDANRPWLRITTGPGNGFSLEPDGIAYDVEVQMKNIGNSPALDVSYLSTFLFYDPTIEELHKLAPKWFDGDGHEWRDKIIFQGDTWDRKSGAIHSGGPPGLTKVNLIVVVRYRTPFDRLWRFTVRIYSLHPLKSGGPTYLDLSDLTNARHLGVAYFDEHQRIAGIAT